MRNEKRSNLCNFYSIIDHEGFFCHLLDEVNTKFEDPTLDLLSKEKLLEY